MHKKDEKDIKRMKRIKRKKRKCLRLKKKTFKQMN